MFATTKRLYIFKTGSTPGPIRRTYGDFDAWIIRTIGDTPIQVEVIDVAAGGALPEIAACAGVIVTGSPAMVTDKLPWSIALEGWLPGLVTACVPVLGICYGHQLLAESLGGQAGDHPLGKEIGTVPVRLSGDAESDPLFCDLPDAFPAHATHTQSALRLPPQTVHLAANDHEPNHAFRYGKCAWGVQFHPEFDATVMRAYIEEQQDNLRALGHDVDALLEQVVETPDAASVLKRFARYVEQASGKE